MCDSTENGNFEQNDSFSINFNQDFTYVSISLQFNYQKHNMTKIYKLESFTKQRKTVIDNESSSLFHYTISIIRLPLFLWIACVCMYSSWWFLLWRTYWHDDAMLLNKITWENVTRYLCLFLIMFTVRISYYIFLCLLTDFLFGVSLNGELNSIFLKIQLKNRQFYSKNGHI